MIELNKEQIKGLLPKITGQTALELQFALELQYVYHEENPFGLMPGVPVYADHIVNPNIVLLGGVGYMHLFGNAEKFEDGSALLDTVKHLYAGSDKKIFFNLYSPGWEEKLEKIFGDYRVDHWMRYNYRLNKESFARHGDWRKQIPEGYEMQHFDVLSKEFLVKHNKDMDFWFPESKRFGWALLKADEIASECSSVYYEKKAADAVSAKIVEISVETKEPYRRKGVALLTCAAFIEYCLSNGFEPNWGCWHYNLESSALALKLGFEEISQRKCLLFEQE